jgi:peptide-methionine (R)-S-oxide reductase
MGSNDLERAFPVLSRGGVPPAARAPWAAIALAVAVAAGLLVWLVAATTAPPEKSYANVFDPGVYACATCGEPLFRSEDKFHSTTRWPSFRLAVAGAVESRPDTSYGLNRTEVLCMRCGAHLGHVFPDGRLAGDTSPDAGLRYCVLSSSLEFTPRVDAD